MWEYVSWIIENFADTDDDKNELSYIMPDLMTQDKETSKRQMLRLYEYYRLLKNKKD